MSQTLIERRVIGGRFFVMEAKFKQVSYREMFGRDVYPDNLQTGSVLKCDTVRYVVDFKELTRDEYTAAALDAMAFSKLMDYPLEPADTFWRFDNGETQPVEFDTQNGI